MTIVNVVAGGPQDFWPKDLLDGKIAGKFIGVDRGGLRLTKMGIPLDAAVGDFDSVSSEEFKTISENADKVIRVKPEKDETDTELGITTAGKMFPDSQIHVYGFMGGRLDHLLTNVLMVLNEQIKPYVMQITLIDKDNVIDYFLPGKHKIKHIDGMKYLDFVPLNPMKMSLIDEKYKLDNFNVEHITSFSSNEFIGDFGTFEFDKGIMMVVQSKD